MPWLKSAALYFALVMGTVAIVLVARHVVMLLLFALMPAILARVPGGRRRAGHGPA